MPPEPDRSPWAVFLIFLRLGLTDHALRNIAETTLGNFAEFERTGQCANQVRE